MLLFLLFVCFFLDILSGLQCPTLPPNLYGDFLANFVRCFSLILNSGAERTGIPDNF